MSSALSATAAATGCPGISEAVAENADLAAFLQHGLVHHLRHRHGGKRQIGRGQRFRDADRMRLKAKRAATEHGAEPSETADHFIGDHVHIVLAANIHDLGEIVARRHDHAARAHHRFGDEGGDRVRSFAQDQLFELGGEPAAEIVLALARMRKAIMMRAARVQNARDRQIEIAMVVDQSGERGRGNRYAVIRLHPADDLLLSCASERVVHVPDELDLGVVRLRAR